MGRASEIAKRRIQVRMRAEAYYDKIFLIYVNVPVGNSAKQQPVDDGNSLVQHDEWHDSSNECAELR